MRAARPLARISRPIAGCDHRAAGGSARTSEARSCARALGLGAAVAVAGLAAPAAAYADDGSGSGDDDDELIVIDDEAPEAAPGRASSTVTRDDLDERQPRSAPDALRWEPGVYVQQTAAAQGSPYLRGRTGQQTVLLFDGIRLNNATWRQGPNQYFFAVDTRTLAAIDVIRGGASTRYGSDALGGVLDAIPRQADPDGPALAPRLALRWGSADHELGGRAEVAARLPADSALLVGFGGRDVSLLEGGGVGARRRRRAGAGAAAWRRRPDPARAPASASWRGTRAGSSASSTARPPWPTTTIACTTRRAPTSARQRSRRPTSACASRSSSTPWCTARSTWPGSARWRRRAWCCRPRTGTSGAGATAPARTSSTAAATACASSAPAHAARCARAGSGRPCCGPSGGADASLDLVDSTAWLIFTDVDETRLESRGAVPGRRAGTWVPARSPRPSCAGAGCARARRRPARPGRGRQPGRRGRRRPRPSTGAG
jgi:hypothetical protein